MASKTLANTIIAGFLLVFFFIWTGCTTVMPAIEIKDGEKWSDARAFKIINASKTTHPVVSTSSRNQQPFNSYEDVLFWRMAAKQNPNRYDTYLVRAVDHLADSSGLTDIKEAERTYTSTGYSVRALPYHIPYSDISSVNLVKITAPTLLALGILTPFFDVYQVDVLTKNKNLHYMATSTNERWVYFPFWCIRPLYFVNNTNSVTHIKNSELAAAFQYLRQQGETDLKSGQKPDFGAETVAAFESLASGAPPNQAEPSKVASGGAKKAEDVDWTRFKSNKVEMTSEQALAIVRGALERTGKRLKKDSSFEGGEFVLERVDPAGFAFKIEIKRLQGGLTMIASIPKTVSFGDVTRLGITQSDKGQETGIALLKGTEQLWEIPFSDANERDRLLSALALLCGQVKTEQAKSPPQI
jgi:hypothetical protein